VVRRRDADADRVDAPEEALGRAAGHGTFFSATSFVAAAFRSKTRTVSTVFMFE
jgi:hypothetical protein